MNIRLTTLLVLFATLSPASSSAQPPAGAPAARICLAPASAQMATGNTAEAIAAVREAFTSFLTGPTIGVAPLTARLAAQVREEARLAGCPYVLFASVRHERNQGSGFLQKMAGEVVQGGAYQVAGAARSTVARAAAGAAASAAGDLSRGVKARDQLTLDYRLETADGAVLLKRSDKGRAKSDGEDLLTPLVERAAESVAAAVAK